VIAEFERELIRERTDDGRRRAMANGVKFGRKPKLSPFQCAEALRRRAAGETLASIAKTFAVDRAGRGITTEREDECPARGLPAAQALPTAAAPR
jgi:DNA invertase Pin-like site-specific DNA recombinase